MSVAYGLHEVLLIRLVVQFDLSRVFTDLLEEREQGEIGVFLYLTSQVDTGDEHLIRRKLDNVGLHQVEPIEEGHSSVLDLVDLRLTQLEALLAALEQNSLHARQHQVFHR